MITDKTCTIPVFIDFLKRLLFKQEKPVFLVVDGHSVHKSKKVKEFVESINGKLKLFIFPGYSPELNPDETVWAYVKHHVVGKKIITGPDQFLKVVKEALYALMQYTLMHRPSLSQLSFANLLCNIYEVLFMKRLVISRAGICGVLSNGNAKADSRVKLFVVL